VVAGKYVIKGVIGSGGVGVVVAADHRTLRCPVALKFLRPEIAHDPQVVQRFLREAHAAASLRSEHVARVMDADSTESGSAYLVMELLEGRDFAALLRDQGRLPIPTAVDYLMQACHAVAEAHSLGIVHRDIKSANLFLTRRADGTPLVKVLDFGLSKAERTPSQATLTKDDHVMGSPHFMSPEQMRSSREADARSDIWSLGVVLYTLLAGRVPFEGTFLTEVCAAVLSGSSPALTTLRPEVPTDLAAVVDRCLRLEPDDRFQTVAELVAALAPFAAAVPVVAASTPAVGPSSTQTYTLVSPAPFPKTPWWTVPRRVAATIALAALAVGGVAGLLIVRTSASRATEGAVAPVATLPALALPAPASEPTALAPTPSAGPVLVAAPPTVRAPAAPRRSTGTGARRAAAPPVAASTISSAPPPRAAPPRSEEDVIMGLPH
jgi:serine/threonine-protein kinase